MIFVQFCIFAAMEKIKSDKAVVVKHTGSHYLLSKLPEWNLFPAVIKGKLRLKGSTSTNPVAVGDIVEFDAGIFEKLFAKEDELAELLEATYQKLYKARDNKDKEV